ncbi:hypothetical protein CEV34_2080 [Brucella pseudogrignonensis]|uniref:Uncharacterized protein n=1 Tax=Brucella pseudogrignonensis TaxID=419475 RepID=A0A256GJ65_9HYPH|nr:hypothetical protein CEV34_2080 [Brucella pseudogrignonensis]
MKTKMRFALLKKHGNAPDESFGISVARCRYPVPQGISTG